MSDANDLTEVQVAVVDAGTKPDALAVVENSENHDDGFVEKRTGGRRFSDGSSDEHDGESHDAHLHAEHRTELFLKTEKLLHFRLSFALASLLLCIGLAFMAHSDLDFQQLGAIVFGVLVYSGIALLLLSRGIIHSPALIPVINSILIGCDVLSLTGLVHYTHGVESDLYVLYLLPILLSSYTFGRRGITGTSLFVSLSYVCLLLAENAPLLPYLLDRNAQAGLAAVYSQQLWRRILGRSALLVSVTFVWGRFCEYMTSLERLSSNRLRDQLVANTDLVAEVKATAAREKLLNSINSALRSTLDLNSIFETAVDELGKALHASCCAVICPSAYANELPIVCESLSTTILEADPEASKHLYFGPEVCEFVLSKKSNYVHLDDGEWIKIFVFEKPAKDPFFAPVQAELKRLNLGSLIIKPMIYAERSKGVLLIAERDPDRQWTPSELQLVNSVAGQVAVAIQHAELVDQLSRKNTDLVQKNLNLDSKNLELRSMQSQLIHQEKMASLGRLVAGIAHELNNPINFVHGNLPYLRNYFEDLKKLVNSLDGSSDENRQIVETLKKELKYEFVVTDLDNILADLNEGTDRIRHIIRNLKSFSRLDEAELKEASIQEGIESTFKILSQYYGRDKLLVQCEFATLPPILCFPGQLNQVWMNLLSNAAQAVEAVAEPSVKVTVEQENSKVLISISDNGTGIKPEVQSKIFEPFYTTKPVGQGTGLGLSICHSIIERHGGQIWCESEVGKGTTFRVRIPIHAKPSDLVVKPASADADPD